MQKKSYQKINPQRRKKQAKNKHRCMTFPRLQLLTYLTQTESSGRNGAEQNSVLNSLSFKRQPEGNVIKERQNFKT